MADQRDQDLGGPARRNGRDRKTDPMIRLSDLRLPDGGLASDGIDTELDMIGDTTDDMNAELDNIDGIDDDRGVPLDLTALRADDVLLNSIADTDPESVFAGVDPELGPLLLSWHEDVRAEPVAELVDTDAAVYAIARGARQVRQRPRYLVPLASAAAVLVVLFTGVGLAARNAQPGDALWGLTQVLYADHARSIQAADVVRNELDHASAALQNGHLSTARSDLDGAMRVLPSVSSEDGQADLRAQGQSLAAQLNASGTGSTYPITVSGSVPVSSLPPSQPSTPVDPTSPTPPTSQPTSPSSPSSGSQAPPPPSSGSSAPPGSTSTQSAPPPGSGGSGSKNTPGAPVESN